MRHTGAFCQRWANADALAHPLQPPAWLMPSSASWGGAGRNPSGHQEAWLASVNPACSDGIDNDGNGLTDFADQNFSPTWPYWERPPTPACGLGAELSIVVPLLTWLRRQRRRRLG